jgi:hypothetical protein
MKKGIRTKERKEEEKCGGIKLKQGKVYTVQRGKICTKLLRRRIYIDVLQDGETFQELVI